MFYLWEIVHPVIFVITTSVVNETYKWVEQLFHDNHVSEHAAVNSYHRPIMEVEDSQSAY